MTDFTKHRSQRRDIQDGAELGVWGAVEDVAGAGRVMRVRGTGTEDLEVALMNLGYGFNLPTDYNAEVMMMSMGSDVNNKVAVPVLPRNLQYGWGEGEGGIQHPLNPERRIEFNDTDTHHTDGVHTFGPNKELTVTVTGGNVTLAFSGNLTINANNVDINSGALRHNGTNVGNSHTHSHGDPAGTTSGPS